MISLEVTESPLGNEITPPAFVRKLDWVANFWPEKERGPGEYPTVMRYCLMSVSVQFRCPDSARCHLTADPFSPHYCRKGGFTDWHVDFAGSCVFYNVRRGRKVFYFIRPTPDNLAAYEKWSGNKEIQESTWLGDLVDEVYKVELTPGNTMTIPTGWIHAVYTPEDSLVFGGNYLHSLEIPTQLAIYRIELATKVPIKYRYPHFVKLTWMVAARYSDRLAELEARGVEPNGEGWPIDLGARVLRGLKELAGFLGGQCARFAKGSEEAAGRQKVARENVPWDIVPDPEGTVRGLRRGVMRGLGEEADAACLGGTEVAKVKAEGVDLAETSGVKARKSASPVARKVSLPPQSLPTASPAPPPPAAAPTRKRKSTAAPTSADPPPPTKPKLAASRPAAAVKPALNAPVSPTPRNLAPTPNAHPFVPRPQLGTLISTKQSPVSSIDSVEPRVDPVQPDGPARLANVRVCTGTTTAVRRRVVDAGVQEEGEEEGMVVVETMTVVTTRERVRISKSEVEGFVGIGKEVQGLVGVVSEVVDGRAGVGAAAYPPGTFSHVPAPA